MHALAAVSGTCRQPSIQALAPALPSCGAAAAAEPLLPASGTEDVGARPSDVTVTLPALLVSCAPIVGLVR